MQWLSTSPAAGSPGNLNGRKTAEKLPFFRQWRTGFRVIRERTVNVPHHSVVLGLDMCDDFDATVTEVLPSSPPGWNKTADNSFWRVPGYSVPLLS